MAIIDRNALLIDLNYYLGGANVVTTARMLDMISRVISQVPADDDVHTPEVFCKVLKIAAVQNQIFAGVAGGGNVKKERSDEREVEFFPTTDPSKFWRDFIDNIPLLCSTLGYTESVSKYAGLFKLKVATPIRYPAGSAQIGTVESRADWNGRPCLNKFPAHD